MGLTRCYKTEVFLHLSFTSAISSLTALDATFNLKFWHRCHGISKPDGFSHSMLPRDPGLFQVRDVAVFPIWPINIASLCGNVVDANCRLMAVLFVIKT